MGRGGVDRTTNPLAAMMDESLTALERDDPAAVAEVEAHSGDVAGVERTAPTAPVRGGSVTGPVRRAGRRPGRPRGGRNSDPDMVPISAKIHKDVRFAMDRVLAEQSELEGRPVYMAEVIERLMRFYVEHGDPYGTVK